MALSESLTRYVGPLPVWGWVGLGGAGLFLIKKFKGSTGLSSIVGSTSGTGTDTTAAAGAGTSAAADAASADDSNTSWASDAISYLEGQGYTSSQAQSAIGTYTAGGQLDPSMATLVDQAYQGAGPPPQLIFPTQAQPTLPTPGGAGTVATTSGGASSAPGQSGSSSIPSYVAQHQAAYKSQGANYTTGGPKDSSGHQAYFKYTVKKGDTQSKLGGLFGTSAKQIEAWNGLKTGQSIKAGQTIWV